MSLDTTVGATADAVAIAGGVTALEEERVGAGADAVASAYAGARVNAGTGATMLAVEIPEPNPGMVMSGVDATDAAVPEPTGLTSVASAAAV